MNTEAETTFAERLRFALDKRGIRKISPWAKGIGAPESSVRVWLKGPTIPRDHGITRIANDLRISRDWLEWGVGEMEPPGAMSASGQIEVTGRGDLAAAADEAFVAELLTNLAADEELSDADVGRLTRAVQRNIPKPKK